MPATAADLPPELFPAILRHLKPPTYGSRHWTTAAAHALPCSLVCLFWATCLRHALWDRAWVDIRSLARADAFRRLCLPPDTLRLVPVIDLVDGLSVQHDFAVDTRPWHYLLFVEVVPFMSRLAIAGPVPPSVPLPSLRTPYWGTPRCLPATVTPYTQLDLSDIAFASLDDVLKLASHFPYATSLAFTDVSWPPYAIARPAVFPHAFHALQGILATRCTDCAALILGLAGIGTNLGAFHVLARADQLALSRLVRAAVDTFPADARDSPIGWSYEVVALTSTSFRAAFSPYTAVRTYTLHVLCQSTGALQPHRITSIALLANSASKHRRDAHDHQLSSALLAFLSTDPWSRAVPRLPALRTVFFALPAFEDVQATHRLHFAPRRQLAAFRLMCCRSEEHSFADNQGGKWVGVEPGVLEPTGETWEDVFGAWQTLTGT